LSSLNTKLSSKKDVNIYCN